MVKIKVLRNYKEYIEGKIYIVGNNEAYSLIDKNIAVLYNTEEPRYFDKMMTSKKSKNAYDNNSFKN